MSLRFLQPAIDRGLFSYLDLHFATFLLDKEPIKPIDDTLLTLICWLSYRTRQGNVCVDLNEFNQQQMFGNSAQEQLIAEQIWQHLPHVDIAYCLHLLETLTFVSDGMPPAPLVLNDERLYLQRMWWDEMILADYFFKQSQHCYVFNDVEKETINRLFQRYFTASNTTETDWQQVAVAVAMLHRVAIISGGPGTGKTTTIAKLLAILLDVYRLQNPDKPLRIALAAPTGKAAARLTESLGKAVQHLPLTDEIKAILPQEAFTLHRLLGVKANSQSFRHNADNPLLFDLVIIDEASMLDISMMARVIEALSPQTRLILLGDHEQLSSVEAGAILGELCAFGRQGYSQACCDEIASLTNCRLTADPAATSLSDILCFLRKSYRFNAESGIGLLAQAINQQEMKSVNKIIQSDFTDLTVEFVTSQDYEAVLNRCTKQYHDYFKHLKQFTVEQILEQLLEFQLLAVVRKGDFGVEGLNKHIEKRLIKQGLIESLPGALWFAGQPIMIRQNHYELGLYNGDVGVILTEPQSGRLRAYFRLANGQITSFSPTRLPQYDTAFAITVHQSQGSEFSRVLLILPEQSTALLTKELIYTAITRAKDQLILVTHQHAFEQAIQTVTKRISGLRQQLNKRFTVS